MTRGLLPIDDPIRLEQFETLVYARRRDDAVRELIPILRKLKRGIEIAGDSYEDSSRPKLYSRLAAAIAALIGDPEFEPDQAQFDRLAMEHPALSAVFRSSVFENPDHLYRQLGTPDPIDPNRVSFSGYHAIVKLLLAYPLDSDMDIDLAEIFRSVPQTSLPAYLGRVGQPVPLSRVAQERFNSLLALSPVFDGVDIEEPLVDAIADAYFYCSYSDAPGKHSIKRSINILLRRFIERRGLLPTAPGSGKSMDRPTVLIPIERFRSNHAMYRCYASYVRKLREKFRVVAIGPSSESDEVSRQCFDEVIGLPDATVSFPEVLARAQAVNPDVVYYPSVGMSPWVIALSTLRLAPVQAMTIGHPATTNSAEMDYVFMPEAFDGGGGCFSETIVVIEGSLSMEERVGAVFPQPSLRPRPDVIRVAVPAALMKLNASFMASCQSISHKCRRCIEFQFFPHCTGMALHQLSRQIRKWLPDAVVHAAADYNDYLRMLASCDVHLSTFPFGGTNSNIDSMRLGIPIVTLEGNEVHGRTDAGMMRAARLPEWLIARDAVEFEAAALRLIEDDTTRLAVSNHLLSIDAESVFFGDAGARNSEDFLAAFSFVCRNHDAIRASGRRHWTIADRAAFG